MRLSQSDRARIHAALAQADAKTSAHFAAVIVPVADRYTLYPLLWGAMAAFLAGALLAIAKPALSLRFGVVIESIVFGAVAFALDWFPARLLAVPARVKRERASRMAHREFAARILASATHREGILFFVALGEHHVEILATREVHAKVGAEEWNAIVARFTKTAAQGRIADGVLVAIDDCAGHLATHFPQ
jgi:putative membrane protein